MDGWKRRSHGLKTGSSGSLSNLENSSSRAESCAESLDAPMGREINQSVLNLRDRPVVQSHLRAVLIFVHRRISVIAVVNNFFSD